jgi:hypothetical protein
LLERSKNVDVEDYDRVKKLARDLQVGIVISSFKFMPVTFAVVLHEIYYSHENV